MKNDPFDQTSVLSAWACEGPHVYVEALDGFMKSVGQRTETEVST